MHPVILTIGTFSISSFGLFLSLAFLVAVFTIWRICRMYDLSEEKILDISLLTFFGSLIGARIYYIITNSDSFDSLSKIILINKYPGLEFWGGILGGLLTLLIFSRRFRISFWGLADFIIIGLFAGLVLGSLGCLLGSCQSGYITNGPLSVTQIGLVGTRFPVQLFDALFFLIGFWLLWKIAIRFHFSGKVASIGLMLLGLIKFITDNWRGEVTRINHFLTVGQLWALLAFIFGWIVFYKQSKRSFTRDFSYLFTPRFRKVTLPKFGKSCYNLLVYWRLSLNKSFKGAILKSKGILRNLNVKSQPPKFQ